MTDINVDSFVTDFEYPPDDYDYIGNIKESLKILLDRCRDDRDNAPSDTAINRYMTLFVALIENELGELL